MVKYVGFDKDGTLIDSMDSYARIWGEIFNNQFGIDKQKASNFLIETSGQATSVQTKNLLEKHNILLEDGEVFKLSNKIAEDLAANNDSKPFKDVYDCLIHLKQLGYKLYISSNQMQTVIKDDLVKFNIENYFEFYAGIRGKNPDFKKGLPHFIEIAKKFKIPFKEFAKQSVYIGDTKTDIDISKEAGMISIIRAKKDKIDHFKHLGADFVVVDFTTLPLLIEKISLSL